MEGPMIGSSGTVSGFTGMRRTTGAGTAGSAWAAGWKVSFAFRSMARKVPGSMTCVSTCASTLGELSIAAADNTGGCASGAEAGAGADSLAAAFSRVTTMAIAMPIMPNMLP